MCVGSDLKPVVIRDTKSRHNEPDFSQCYHLPELPHPNDNYSLKTSAWCLLGERVQQGGVQAHKAVDDAKTTMRLYRLDELAFERNART